YRAQLRYIQLAQSRSKPSQAEEVQLLAPTSEKISAIQQFREKNRVSSFFNHLSAISESIPALGWVAVSPTPAPYVKEMNDAGQFYTNRVLKEWKEKDKRHVEWCRAWVQLLSDLQAYVKQQHTTGLVWSGTGAGAPPPPPPGGLPPPPPMLPEAEFANLSVDDRSALFAEINQGEGITSNLRKVTADMQTHKNPTLRQGPAPFKAAHSAPAPAPAPAKPLPQPGAGKLDKPPVFMRDGKKWLIVSITHFKYFSGSKSCERYAEPSPHPATSQHIVFCAATREMLTAFDISENIYTLYYHFTLSLELGLWHRLEVLIQPKKVDERLGIFLAFVCSS
ncbi:Adenylyl cyclase-associated protein 2, partial [Papilio xuthus]